MNRKKHASRSVRSEDKALAKALKEALAQLGEDQDTEADNRAPSMVLDEPWVWAMRGKDQPRYPVATPRSGKWLVFVPREEIDDVWLRVATAVRGGRLGGSAKVATGWENPNAADPEKKVICVYTYDSDDLEDVRRIRQELRNVGIVWKIPYKTDEATYAGHYVVRGSRRVSKYYE